jgi:hypothetical protein
MRSVLGTLLALSLLVLAACGGGSKDVNTATYTCADFNKSLKTKGDDTAGNFINQLRKKAILGQSDKVERSEITLGILATCRNKPASTKPADQAIVVAKQIKARAEKLRSQAGGQKKSSK